MHDRYHVTRNTTSNRPGMYTITKLGNTQARSLPQKQIAAVVLRCIQPNAPAWSLRASGILRIR